MLPHEDLLVHTLLPPTGEPQIDYNRSHILTSDEFLAFLVAKAVRKQVLLEEAQARKIAAEDNKEMRRLEKLEKERRCLERTEQRAAKKLEKQYWDKVKRDGWGDKLHKLIKASIHQEAIPGRNPYDLSVPQVCRYNQRIAILRTKFKKKEKDPRLVVPAMAIESNMRIT
jgi:hypothetical protein